SMLFGDGSFDYVLWTISIEFYGSLLVFALYALIGKFRRFSIAFCAALASCLLFLPRSLSIYSLFFLGAALAHVDFVAIKTLLGRRAGLVSLPMLALGCYLFGFFESSASYQWLQPVTATIHGFATHANPSNLYPALGSLCILIAVLIGTGQHKPSRGTGA